jgi:hypothetical protein
LRFASQRPVEHLRLQVHDAAGALTHDSGLVAKAWSDWRAGSCTRARNASSQASGRWTIRRQRN